ncbi:MAG: T9SS type A sorting domain-containing protein [Paludibacter sp.]
MKKIQNYIVVAIGLMLVGVLTASPKVGEIITFRQQKGMVYAVDSVRFWVISLNENTETAPWGNYGNAVLNKRFSDALTALTDTATISNTLQMNTLSVSTDAVKQIDSGWYIPTAGDLRHLFSVYDVLNTKLKNTPSADTLSMASYWSSSEFDKNCAWSVSLREGIMLQSYKNEFLRVRAVQKISLNEIATVVSGGTADNQTNLANTIVWNTGTSSAAIGNLQITNCAADGAISGTNNLIISADASVFKDVLNKDFSLSTSSVCLNSGNDILYQSTFSSKDLAGKSRKNGKIDMGAYEFDDSITFNDLKTSQISKISIYPNPTSEKLYINSTDPVSSVKLYSIDGILVLSLDNKLITSVVLNLNNLKKGIYILRLDDKESKRIILN